MTSSRAHLARWSVSRRAATALATLSLAGFAACGNDASAPTGLTPTRKASAIVLPTTTSPIAFATDNHGCTLISGVARCWGPNDFGQLGDGTTITKLTQTPVQGGITFATLAIQDGMSCGLSTSGKAYCWGANLSGSLGDGTTVDHQPLPSPVLGSDVFVQLVAGYYDTCGLTAEGRTKCWALNNAGEGPLPVAGPRFARLYHGGLVACGLTSASDAYCWPTLGFNFPIGDGNPTASGTPTAVTGGIKFTTLATGYVHMCGLDVSGKAYCWGRNKAGQLGDGTNVDKLVPTPVATPLRFAHIFGSNSTTCALTRESKAFCWGNNSAGMLGDGTWNDSWTPVPVAGGLRFKSLTNGWGASTCGVATDDKVYCWGWNYYGGLGDGTTISRNVPTLIAP